MRSNEERVAEVKRRIEQNKRQEELQRSRIVMASVVAASLLVIAGLSAFMPGIRGMKRMELIENVLQFLVTLLGVCLSGIYYRRSRKQVYFLLTCFMDALHWALFTGHFI